MKRFFILLLVFSICLLAGCGSTTQNQTTEPASNKLCIKCGIDAEMTHVNDAGTQEYYCYVHFPTSSYTCKLCDEEAEGIYITDDGDYEFLCITHFWENSEQVHETEQTISRLSSTEAGKLFDEEFEKLEIVIDDWSEMFNYWNENDFSTIEDVQKYEAMWNDLYERTTEIANTLAGSHPPENWEEHWNAYIQCLQDTSASFLKCANWDTNKDGQYQTSEMSTLLKEEKDIQVAALREAMQLIDALKADSTTIVTPPDNNSSSNSDVCTECGKPADNYYINPFSGNEEPYCQTHYQEIIAIMGEMESDVGNSNQSKHTCEMCSREGTHVYYSFTGQTEYYCTQHYEELMDMLEELGIE